MIRIYLYQLYQNLQIKADIFQVRLSFLKAIQYDYVQIHPSKSIEYWVILFNVLISIIVLNKMELTQPNEQVEPIQVDSLIWSEPQSSNREEPRGWTAVGKGIKSAYILSHIKPDYGSLGEFMKDVGITKDILLHNRKKKQDQQEDQEQKRMRATLRGKNLQKLIRQDGPVLERATASKMIVESLFEKNFGSTLSAFCQSNTRLDSGKASYSSISALADTLDQLLHRTHEQDSDHRDSKPELPTLTRNRNMLSSKEVTLVSLKERLEKATQVQALYPSLRKHTIAIEDKGGEGFGCGSTFLINSSNCNFAGIIEGIRRAKIEEINRIRVVGALHEDLLCYVLDFFAGIRNGGVCELIIEGMQIGSKAKVIQKVKEFIECTSVCRVAFHNTGLSSKDFCVLCLGIGAKFSFDHFSLRNNDIGELALRCLDVLMKFHKNLQFDFTGNPIEKEIKGKSAYKRCLIVRPIE